MPFEENKQVACSSEPSQSTAWSLPGCGAGIEVAVLGQQNSPPVGASPGRSIHTAMIGPSSLSWCVARSQFWVAHNATTGLESSKRGSPLVASLYVA